MRPILKTMTRALLPIHRHGRSFAGSERASTAIEFGLLALPFFTIIGAILETSMVFFAGQVLDSAVQDATRLIRTGQAQSGGYTATTFRGAICSGLYRLFDCSKLKIKVSVLSTFSSTASSVSTPIKTSCNPSTDPNQCWNVVESYNPGAGSSIILVEAYYKWDVMINFGGFNLQNQPDGSRLLAAVRVFRNEPFS
jgi:hypothetical protein